MDHDEFLDAPTDAHDAFLDAPPDEGALMAAGRGALRNVPFAQQAVAAIEPGDYGENIKNMTDKAEAAKAAHGIAYGTGAVFGTAAPLILGQPETLAGSIGLNAGLGAAQGISDTNLVAQPGQAAKQALTGGAVGGVTAGLLGKLGQYYASKAAPKAAEAISEPLAAPLAETAANAVPDASLEAAGASAQAAPTLQKPDLTFGGRMSIPDRMPAPDFIPSAKRAYAHSIAQGMGITPRQLLKLSGKDDPVDALYNFGHWMETAGPEGKSINGLLDRPGELMGKIEALHDEFGKTIGDIVKNEGGQSSQNELTEVWYDLDNQAKQTIDPQTKARLANLMDAAENMQGEGHTDFEAIQQLKQMAAAQIKKDPEMALTYGSLAERVNGIVDRYSKSINNPEVAAAFQKAREGYKITSRVLPGLKYAEAKDIIGGAAGHHTLRGLLEKIGDLAATATGVPPASQIARNIALKTAPMAQGIASGAAATKKLAGKGLSYLPQAAQLELTNYLQDKFKKGQ